MSLTAGDFVKDSSEMHKTRIAAIAYFTP